MPSEVSFLIDENLPFELISFFKKKHFRAEHIKKIGKAGIRNGEVYLYAENNNHWIISRDADFQSYFKFNKYNVRGVIVIKTSNTTKPYILRVLDKFMKEHRDKLNEKHYNMKIYKNKYFLLFFSFMLATI